MPRIRAFMLALTALVAGGCATMRQVDYLSHMPTQGVIVTSPSRGPAEVAQYQLERGTLKLVIQEATPHPRAKLLLTLRAGQTLHLLGATLLATPPPGSTVVTATVVSVQANVIEAGVGHSVELAASDEIIGATDEVSRARQGLRRQGVSRSSRRSTDRCRIGSSCCCQPSRSMVWTRLCRR